MFFNTDTDIESFAKQIKKPPDGRRMLTVRWFLIAFL